MRIEAIARAGVALGFIDLLGAAPAAGIGAHAEHGHPAKRHEGTCEDLGRVAASFNGVVGAVAPDGPPGDQAAAVNADRGDQVMRSETTTDVVVVDARAAPHAVMVRESDEDLTGNVGGAWMGDEPAVGLAEMNRPGHVGMAMFAEGDAETVVTIHVGHALAPVSAGGGAAVDRDHARDHAHAREGDGHDHAYDDGEDVDDHGVQTGGGATPEADA